MKKLIIIALLLCPSLAAQTASNKPYGIVAMSSTPGACRIGQPVVMYNHALYICDGTNYQALSGGGGSGDVVGQASSVNNEVVLWSGTDGKHIKRATGSGIAKLASGVLSAGAASTDLTDAASLVTTTTITNFTLSPSFKIITVQPVTDLVTATFRRLSAAQTSHFLDLQDEANGVLTFFDKTGKFNGDVIGNVTGNVSGSSGSTTGNAATSSAADHTPTACGANTFAQSQSTAWAFTCAGVSLTAAVSGILPGANGGTANGFMAFSGPASSLKTFTLPNANATILTDNAAVTVAQGGTGLATLTTNNVILGNGTSAPSFVAPGTSGNVLTSNGTTWTSATPAAAGDFSSNTSTSVDSEVVLFSGTAGKTGKRATGTGVASLTSGVLSAITNVPIGEGTGTGLVITDASAAGLEVGPAGSTSPVLRVVDNVASQATGLEIKGNASGSGVTLTALGGTNESISLVPKGTGSVIVPINGSNAAPSLMLGSGSTNGLWVRSGTIDLVASSNDVLEFHGTLGLLLTTHAPVVGWTGNGTVGQVARTGLSEVAAGVVGVGTGAGASTAGTLQSAEYDQVTVSNGAQRKLVVNSELITLSTSGTTTDSSANLLPADSVIDSVTCRITTTITTATNWSVGDGTIAARFAAANSTLTSGTTSVGLAHVDQTGTSGPRQTSAAKLRITTTGTPGAGVIRCSVFATTFVAPTS